MTSPTDEKANIAGIGQASSFVYIPRIIRHCEKCNQLILREVTVDLDGYRVEFAAGQEFGTKVFDKAGQLIPQVVDVQVKHKCGKLPTLKLTMFSCPENDHIK